MSRLHRYSRGVFAAMLALSGGGALSGCTLGPDFSEPNAHLPDNKTFKGPAELKKILKDKKDLFARNLVEKLMIYALGRGLEHYDRPAIDAVVAALAKNDYRFSVLVTEITKSLPFRYRRGKELSQ